MIRIFIVAPVPAVRAGLRALLAREGVETLGEASSLAGLSPFSTKIDVILLTSDAYRRGLLEQVLSGPEPPAVLLLLDSGEEPPAEFSRTAARAWGVLLIEAGEDELQAAVQALHQGLIVAPPAIFQSLVAPRPTLDESEAGFPLEPLTERELDVLHLLAQGLANKQIGQALGISEHTVKYHISGVYTKLQVSSRTEAVRQGVRRGLVVL